MGMEVCVVDDEDGIGKMCRDYLSDSYSVKVFTDPREALEAFENDYRPDLVLTDIKMPGVDGFEVAKRLHRKNPELPVVMMSGYADKNHLIQAIENEAVGFIEKPFSMKKMKSTLESAIRKSRHHLILEELNRKYAALTATLQELNARYVQRYAEAENRLIQADMFHHPNVREALEFLMSMKAENRLHSSAEKLLEEIQDLQRQAQDQLQSAGSVESKFSL